jgi:hypothetical protein
MNRKFLAAIMVVPVLFFATERVIGINEKKLHEHEAVTPNAGVNKPLDNEKIFNTNFTNEELMVEMKATILNRKGREKEFDQTEYATQWDEEKLGAPTIKFLKTHVVKKLEVNNICVLDLQKSFSRCPSGYEAFVIVNNGTVTNEGWLLANSGCDREPIAMFRYDVSTSMVEGKISNKAGYLPMDDFCKLYKAAKKDLKKVDAKTVEG